MSTFALLLQKGTDVQPPPRHACPVGLREDQCCVFSFTWPDCAVATAWLANQLPSADATLQVNAGPELEPPPPPPARRRWGDPWRLER